MALPRLSAGSFLLNSVMDSMHRSQVNAPISYLVRRKQLLVIRAIAKAWFFWAKIWLNFEPSFLSCSHPFRYYANVQVPLLATGDDLVPGSISVTVRRLALCKVLRYDSRVLFPFRFREVMSYEAPTFCVSSRNLRWLTLTLWPQYLFG